MRVLFGLGLGLLLAFGCGDERTAEMDAGGESDGGAADAAIVDGGASDAALDAGADAAVADAGVDGGPPEVDAGPPMLRCPSGTPDRDARAQGSQCCARTNHMGADEFALRLAYMDIHAPESLSSLVIETALNDELIAERFTWLVDVSSVEGTVAMRSGFGRSNVDGSFAFAMDDAPAPGDPSRWNPVTLTGTQTGDEIMAAADVSSFTLPIFDEVGGVALELPTRGLVLESMHVDEDHSCVGEARISEYDLDYAGGGDVATLTAYLTVADAMAANVDLPGLQDNLCDFLAGRAMTAFMGMPENFCVRNPQSEWPFQPDAFCSGGACTHGAAGDCGAEMCNAWQLEIAFAAHGVTVSN